MHCSDERKIAFNILPFCLKWCSTVIETISKSLRICTFNFSCLSTAFIIGTLVLIVVYFLLLVLPVDIVAMPW